MSMALTKISRGLNVVETLLNRIAAAILFVMMLAITLEIIGRQVGFHVTGVYEFMGLLMVPVVFFSQGYVQNNRMHITMELVVDRLKPKQKVVAGLLSDIFTFIIIVVFFYYVTKNALNAYYTGDIVMGAARFVTWPARMTISIGLFFFATRCFLQIIETIIQLINYSQDELIEN